MQRSTLLRITAALALTLSLGLGAGGCANSSRTDAPSSAATTTAAETSQPVASAWADEPPAWARPAPGTCWLRDGSNGVGQQVPCSQPHAIEVTWSWAEYPDGDFDDQAVAAHTQSVCDQLQGTTSPRHDESTGSAYSFVIYPIDSEWQVAHSNGTPVRMVCAWRYVTDQTGFAGAGPDGLLAGQA